ARRPLRRALTLAPAQPRILAANAGVLADEHRVPDAGWLGRALASGPEDAGIRGNLSVALRKRGVYRDAWHLGRGTLASEPALPEILNNLAMLEIKARAPEKAEVWSNRAIAARAGYAEA